VQTFLPYQSCVKSASVLDMRRLGKQRVETLQILRCLVLGNSGWQHHPAVKMWKGYELFLSHYGCCICREWIKRGYQDTCLGKIKNTIREDDNWPPNWFGDDRLHSSHRSKLLNKNPVWYSQFGWTEKPDMNYFWPV
jgi:hypothetical protein